MGSEIEMDESPCSYLHDQKHINDLKADGDGDEEITGQYGLGMVADEGHPARGWNGAPSAAIRILQQILPDSSR